MARVEVWNKNIHDYEENFNGEIIKIPAGKHILMEYDQAVLFRGSMQTTPLTRRGGGEPDPRSFKMIVIGKAVDGPVPIAAQAHVCQACKYIGRNAQELEAHSVSAHSDAIIVDESVPEKPVDAGPEKRGPGRPKRAQAVAV